MGQKRMFTVAELRAQVLRTPGATLDEESPAYPESWKGQGNFAQSSLPPISGETEK